jgi:hypothetical protein
LLNFDAAISIRTDNAKDAISLSKQTLKMAGSSQVKPGHDEIGSAYSSVEQAPEH